LKLIAAATTTTPSGDRKWFEFSLEATTAIGTKQG